MNGSYDEATAVDRMRAIDEAMRVYFESEAWLAVRRKTMPGAK